jgi:hypothetical protein
MYFDMFYIQWHRLARKDLWNKVYMNMNKNMNENSFQPPDYSFPLKNHKIFLVLIITFLN